MTPFVIVSLMPLWVGIVAVGFGLTFGRSIAQKERAERLAREDRRAVGRDESIAKTFFGRQLTESASAEKAPANPIQLELVPLLEFMKF
jgi:hypothetical protein